MADLYTSLEEMEKLHIVCDRMALRNMLELFPYHEEALLPSNRLDGLNLQ